MTRRATRRGGALKGLAAVLAFLVVLFLYLSWQGGMTPEGFLALLFAIPIWFYIAVLSVGVVFVASLARESVMASRSAAKASASSANRRAPSRSAGPPMSPAPAIPRRDKPPRMVIDFVPVKPGSSAVSAAVAGSSEEEPAISDSPEEAASVNVWPTETIPLGKPPRDRAPRPSPPPEPAPVAIAPAIPEPYLGPELESGPEPFAASSMDAAVNGPPDTLLGRLMNWLDETSPEAVATPEPANRKRTRRTSKKRGG